MALADFWCKQANDYYQQVGIRPTARSAGFLREVEYCLVDRGLHRFPVRFRVDDDAMLWSWDGAHIFLFTMNDTGAPWKDARFRWRYTCASDIPLLADLKADVAAGL